jgi:hypothetical protein
MALRSVQPITEISTRNLPGGKKRPARRADNLAAICEPIVQKMWEPQPLAILRASTACTGIALPLPNYVHSLFIASTCFGRTWVIIRQHLLLGETTALYTLSLVHIGTSLLLLLICFIGYFYPIFLSSHFSISF